MAFSFGTYISMLLSLSGRVKSLSLTPGVVAPSGAGVGVGVPSAFDSDIEI